MISDMKTRIVEIDPEIIKSSSLRWISGVLKRDGIIVYPTDTFYGLGADCFSADAVNRIYALKKRNSGKALSVIAAGMEMVKSSTINQPPVFFELAEKFWPGPLTIILEAAPRIPEAILGSAGTLGIRWPNCPWIEELLQECGFPLTATSANLSGQSEISRPEDAIKVFNNRVECIVSGGPTPGGKPSTIVDLTKEKPVILRKGAVPVSQLIPFF